MISPSKSNRTHSLTLSAILDASKPEKHRRLESYIDRHWNDIEVPNLPGFQSKELVTTANGRDLPVSALEHGGFYYDDENTIEEEDEDEEEDAASESASVFWGYELEPGWTPLTETSGHMANEQHTLCQSNSDNEEEFEIFSLYSLPQSDMIRASSPGLPMKAVPLRFYRADKRPKTLAIPLRSRPKPTTPSRHRQHMKYQQAGKLSPAFFPPTSAHGVTESVDTGLMAADVDTLFMAPASRSRTGTMLSGRTILSARRWGSQLKFGESVDLTLSPQFRTSSLAAPSFGLQRDHNPRSQQITKKQPVRTTHDASQMRRSDARGEPGPSSWNEDVDSATTPHHRRRQQSKSLPPDSIRYYKKRQQDQFRTPWPLNDEVTPFHKAMLGSKGVDGEFEWEASQLSPSPSPAFSPGSPDLEEFQPSSKPAGRSKSVKQRVVTWWVTKLSPKRFTPQK